MNLTEQTKITQDIVESLKHLLEFDDGCRYMVNGAERLLNHLKEQQEEKQCSNCKHWKQQITYDGYGIGSGECTMIGGELDIEITAGLDGGDVGQIYTESDFYCKLHEK